MTKNPAGSFLDAIEQTKPDPIEGLTDFLNLIRVTITMVVDREVSAGRGLRALVYIGKGPSAPAEWISALYSALHGCPVLSVADRTIIDGNQLHLMLLDETHSAKVPKPEEYGLETQYITTGLNLGIATAVFKAKVNSADDDGSGLVHRTFAPTPAPSSL